MDKARGITKIPCPIILAPGRTDRLGAGISGACRWSRQEKSQGCQSECTIMPLGRRSQASADISGVEAGALMSVACQGSDRSILAQLAQMP